MTKVLANPAGFFFDADEPIFIDEVEEDPPEYEDESTSFLPESNKEVSDETQ